MALVIVGSVTRPSGSDSYPPAAGTVVPYAYAQPIVDLDAQADEHGWRDLGKLGNLEHLKKHGGHTPWRSGSKRGVVWAMDRTMPAGFRQWLVATCKSNYDTTWIRFFNIDGMQFGQDGTYLRSSPDHHLHLEVEDGSELKHVTLFEDYAREAGVMTVADDVWGFLLGSQGLGVPEKAITEWLKSFEQGARDARAAKEAVAPLTGSLQAVLSAVQALDARLTVIEGKVDAIAVAAGDPDAIADELAQRLANNPE